MKRAQLRPADAQDACRVRWDLMKRAQLHPADAHDARRVRRDLIKRGPAASS